MRQKQLTARRWLIMAASLVSGALFLWSGLNKVARPYDFLMDVYRYELVNAQVGLLVAMALPWLEVILGMLLLTRVLGAGALLGGMILAAIFTFVQLYALREGLLIRCGCLGMGAGDDWVGRWTVMRAWLLFLLNCAAWVALLRTPVETHRSATAGGSL